MDEVTEDAATKTKRDLQTVHERAVRGFDVVHQASVDEREQAQEDRRFATQAGAQWEGDLGRQFANSPRFESNKLRSAILRVYSEYRNNEMEVSFISKDGSESGKNAEFCNALLRADIEDSNAPEAFDAAFDEAANGGYGAFRLKAVYEDENDPENEKQRIAFEPIYEADAKVYFDLGAKTQDKRDAKKCWVITPKLRDEYEDEFGKIGASSWAYSDYGMRFDWCTPDFVYLCEYYELELVAEKYFTFEDASGKRQSICEDDVTEEMLSTFEAIGTKKVGERTVKERKVHKYILDGNSVLEDCGYIVGEHIPIIPVYGMRWFTGGVERFAGLTRMAKDPQRLANVMRSKLVEIASQAANEIPIFTPEQIAKHQTMWNMANINKPNFLLVDPIIQIDGSKTLPAPIYTKPPSIPPALAALIEIAERDLQDTLGNQQAAEKVASNISAEAIELVQTRTDMQSYIYLHNFAKAYKRAVEVWLSMAREVYYEDGRTVKVIGDDGNPSGAVLKQPAVVDGAVVTINDMGKARFDVRTVIGPASQSKKAKAVKNLSALSAMATDPDTKAILEALAVMNMEFDGASDVAQFFRKKLVAKGVINPTEEERKELEQAAQNQPPDAQTQYLQAAAQEANAKAVKANADTVLTVAKAEETKARTAEILSGLSIDQQRHLMELAQQLGQAEPPAAIQGEHGVING